LLPNVFAAVAYPLTSNTLQEQLRATKASEAIAKAKAKSTQ